MSTGIPKNGINKGWIKKGSKLPPKTVEKIKLSLLGNSRALGKTGYKHTKAERKKISDSKIGKKRNVTWGDKISRALIGKKRSEEFLLKGERNPNWKGGITLLTQQIRHSFEYRQWRSDVFSRDNFTCVLCGQRGYKIEADHYPKMFSTIFYENQIKSLKDALNCEEFWSINNGRTLCKKCHDKTRGSKQKLCV